MAEKKSKDTKPSNININLDTTPILYTDRIGISVNTDGVVLDVMQRIGPTNKARIVSRIGMSREHAMKFSQEFGRLIAVSQGSTQTRKKVN